jgi:hypothetical protein
MCPGDLHPCSSDILGFRLDEYEFETAAPLNRVIFQVHERLPSQTALELLTGQLLQPHALIDCQVFHKLHL